MNHRRAFVVTVAIVIVIAIFLAAYLFLPNSATAPISNRSGIGVTVPTGAVIIPMSLVTIRENASTSPSVNIEYPQFPSLPADFNAAIASAVTSRLTDFRQAVTENSAARDATTNNLPGEPGAAIPSNTYSFIATLEEAQINGRYVSFIIRFDSYTGGANENQEIETFNYDVMAAKIMSLADLFPAVPGYLNKISTVARQQLTDSLSAASTGYDPASMLDAGTVPTDDNFKNFTFTDYSVTFYFQKYTVAPGSFGEQRATIPIDSIK